MIYNVEQDSPAWDELRAGRVTGTRFQTLVSGMKTKGYQDLILDITGEILTGEREPSFSNDIMQRGIDLEPEGALEYERVTKQDVELIGFVTKDGDLEEWTGVSPDRLIKNDGILEIKCPLRKTHLKYLKGQKLPTEYKHQVQSQMWVTGRKYVDFMSFYPKLKPFIIRVYPDLELFADYEERMTILIKDVKELIKTYKSL